MNISPKIQAILDNPSTVEGTRHREALRVCAYLVGEGMPHDEVKATLEKAYPHMINRQGGKEIDNMIKGAAGLGLKPTAEREYKPVDRRHFKIGVYTAPVHAQPVKSLPEPIKSPSSEFINRLFKEGEQVAFVNEAALNSDGKWQIVSAGVNLDRDVFAEKMKSPKRFNTPAGAWIRINPTTGAKDSDVTDYRYCMVEGDAVSKEQQYAIYKKSGLPIAALVDSGGKSIHAWVKVEAENLIEYKDRVEKVYSLLAEMQPDTANRNPSRWTRMPGIMRGDKEQSLLSWEMGALTWDEWEVQQEESELPNELSLDDLERFDRHNDVLNMLGNRWLCKGGSLLLQGASGVGKSTLTLQAAITWSIGRDLFGIAPTRPLKISVIQAENDLGDQAEAWQDSKNAMKLLPHETDLLKSNVRIFREQVRTGQAFVKLFRNVALRTKADLIFVDPLLAYIGGDISETETASTFLRNWISPILEESGVIVCFVHHLGKRKPGDDIKSMTASELAYSGLGSSELVNWCREVMTLAPHKESDYRLAFGKRANRTGNFLSDKEIRIKHSENGQTWELVSNIKTTYKLARNPMDKLKKLEGLTWPEVQARVGLVAPELIKGKTVEDFFSFGEDGRAVLK